MTIPTYEIIFNGRAIRCLWCKFISWKSSDIEAKYCYNCKRFHQDRAQKEVAK